MMKQSQVAGSHVQMLLKANGLVSLVNTQTCMIPSSVIIKKEGIYNEMASMHMEIYKTAPLQKETVCRLHPDNWQELIACKDRRSHSKPGRFDGHHLRSWKVSKYKKVFYFIVWIFRNQKENKKKYMGIADEKGAVEG